MSRLTSFWSEFSLGVMFEAAKLKLNIVSRHDSQGFAFSWLIFIWSQLIKTLVKQSI